MNAAARALHQSSIFNSSFSKLGQLRHTISFMGLMVALLLSALAVVYVKYNQRYLFSELQSLRQTTLELQYKRGQLILEQSSLITPAKIQHRAQALLEMQRPRSDQVVLIKW